jgi:hypothetical protein
LFLRDVREIRCLRRSVQISRQTTPPSARTAAREAEGSGMNRRNRPMLPQMSMARMMERRARRESLIFIMSCFDPFVILAG